MGQGDCRGGVRGELWTGEGNRSCPGKQPKSDYSGGAGHGASGCVQEKEPGELFGERADRELCCEARCIRSGDRDYKLQCAVRETGAASIYDEDRHIHGYAGGIRGYCLPLVQISGYVKCGSETEAAGIVREKPGDGSRMGDAECKKSDAGINRRNEGKLLDYSIE